MTKPNDELSIQNFTVVSVDICSSSRILEDLLASENAHVWRDFLIRLKNFLRRHRQSYSFVIYKFTGDGWILLFPTNVDFRRILSFLQLLSQHFDRTFAAEVEGYLDWQHRTIGVRFGIDRGPLVGFVMNEQHEYIGRAVNAACRLQGAISQNDSRPQYKALIANHLYRAVQDRLGGIVRAKVERRLRNMSRDEPVRCVKLTVYLPAKPSTATAATGNGAAKPARSSKSSDAGNTATNHG